MMTQTSICQNPGNCKVLLIEDDNLLSIVLSMQLESAGFNFCTAANGHQALSLLRSHRPRVLVLDISLPGLTGFQLIEKLQNDPDLTDLKEMRIIVHTSHDLSVTEQNQLSLGHTVFLTKTRATTDLAAVVAQSLQEFSPE